MIKPRLVLPLLAIIALAVTLAACGSGASTTPGGAGASAPTDTAKIVDGGILRIGYTDRAEVRQGGNRSDGRLHRGRRVGQGDR